MTKLHISDDLSLPVDAVTQKLAFLGRTGSGKTYAATKLAEQMLQKGAQLVALDPVGVWCGLRMGSYAFEIPVLGGLRGDIPLEPTSGALVADVIVDRGTSAVLDVSQMIAAEQARFATDFATRFFQRKKAAPSAVHLFIEECQEFVPQNPQRGEERMLHAFQRLQKLGRNFGIGTSLISQRPQEVSKKALNQSECVFAFQMTGPHERKAMASWVAEQGLDTDVQALLPKLAVGHAHVWSPQWLNVSREVAIGRKQTLDVSATPKVGAAASDKPRKLLPIDLEKLGQAVADTIERAKADDPRELRRRIAELERAAAKLAPDQQASDLAIKARALDDAVKVLDRFYVSRDAALDVLHSALTTLTTAATSVEKLYNDVADSRIGLVKALDTAVKFAPFTDEQLKRTRPVPAPTRKAPAAGSPNGISPYARSLLEVMAQREPMRLTRAQISTLSGRSPKSSAFAAAMAEIAREGLAHSNGSQFELTEAGRAFVPMDRRTPRSAAEVRAQWRSSLPGYERALFDVLCEVYPKALARERLAERAGKSLTSSAFAAAISTLAKNGLATIGGGEVRASDDLFMEVR